MFNRTLSKKYYSKFINYVKNHDFKTHRYLNVEASSVQNQWCTISGFSRLAARKDLELALGELTPNKIDPILDSNYYFTGKYALLVDNFESITVFKNYINQRHPEKYKVDPLSIKTMGKYSLASNLHISNQTIRCSNIISNIGLEELYYLFEDYEIQKNGITFRKTSSSQQYTNYFINFLSPEEAERAVMEKSRDFILNGSDIRLFWYNC